MICQQCPFFQESNISNQFGVCDDVEFTPVRLNWVASAICESKLNGFKIIENHTYSTLVRGDWEISVPIFDDHFVITNSTLKIGVTFDTLSEAINYCDKVDKNAFSLKTC